MIKSLIIGGSGLIGGALLDYIKSMSESVYGTYTHSKEPGLIFLDLFSRDYSALQDLHKGDIVYLLSAYSNPNWIAQNRNQAEELNLTCTKSLIDFLITKEVKIIFMSSVEVFDGIKGNYAEEDETHPLNYYGVMKLKIEDYLESNYDNYTIARTGWNVGFNEKSRCVVQLTYETLLSKNAKMATDNYFSLCHTEDTAKALYFSSKQNNMKKIHIASSEVINRFDMAGLIKKHSAKGNLMNFEGCYFNEIPYSEPRGRVNDLNNSLSRIQLNMNYHNA